MINFDSLIESLKTSFSKTVQPIISGMSQAIKPVTQTVQPIQNEAAKVVSEIPKLLGGRIQSNIQAPSFHGMEPLKIIDSIKSSSPVQAILNRPLIPKTPGIGILGYLQGNDASPKIGEYFKNQVLDPIKSGISDLRKPGLTNKGLGALQILGGVFGSTPIGVSYNVGTGALAGAARSIRTGQDLQQSIKQGVGSPTSISTEGLGIENPFLAMGLDLVISSPKEVTSLATHVFKPGIAANIAETSVKSKERQLYELLSYENELRKRGFTDSQRANMGIKKARQVLGWTEEEATKALNKAQEFATEKKATFDKLFSDWIGARETAKTIGTDYAIKYAKIPTQIGWDVIRGLEGAKDISTDASSYVNKLRQTYDELHDLANKSGLDTAYLNSYVNHIWKQTPSEVAATYKAVSRKFKFANKREIPTYEEGIKMGLTPLFEHPALLLENYVKNMESVKSNLIFFNKLKKEGLVLDAAVGVSKIGFSAITAPGIPPSAAKNAAGELIRGPFYAPTQIANLINKIFSPEDETTLNKITSYLAKVSGKIQDFAFSGGLVYSPLNAFSIMAGAQRELLAGRPKTIGNFIEAFSQGKTIEYFNKHSSTIKDMQRRNIPMNTLYKAENFIDKGLLENIFGGGIGQVWDRAVNEKTFKGYLPSLQISFFEDVRDAALKQGKSGEQALDIAAQATKNFYGIVSSDALAKGSKFAEDLKTILFLAPKYRASILNFWWNNIKAISPLHLSTDGGLKIKGNNPLALQNIYNTRFVVGATIDYLIRDRLNLRFVGRHLSENPPGTETTLLIPLEKITGNKEDKTVIGIPWLSSLGTVPITLGKMGVHAAQGNFPQVMKDAAGFPSLAIKAPIDIMNNENFYGQEIYNVNDPADIKGKKIGRHLIENYSHPYIRAASELGLIPGIPKKDQPLLATVSKTLELPFRFYDEDKLKARYYFAERDKAFKGNTEAQNLSGFKGNPDDPNDDTQTAMTKAAIRLSKPDILRAETQAAKETSKKTGEALYPFYTLPEPYQKVVLRYQSLPPGSSDKKAILAAQPWLKEYWAVRDDYFKGKPNISTRPIPNDYVKQQLENKNFADVQVQQYLNANTAYTNTERLKLDLPELPPYQKRSFTKRIKPKKLKLSLKGLGGKKLTLRAPKFKFKPLKPLKVRELKIA